MQVRADTIHVAVRPGPAISAGDTPKAELQLRASQPEAKLLESHAAFFLLMLPVRSSADTPGGASALTVPQAMQHALAAYQRGESAEAERLCRLVLDAKADYFDALYLSAIIAGQTGRAEEAAELLAKAVTVNPGIANAYYNRGVALGELNRHTEAVESYERAIALKPDHADAYYNLAVALGELDRHAEAV